MAKPVTARFGAFTVSLSDGNSPAVFTAPCGFTSKSLSLTKSLSEITIPDCDDPDAPSWVGRDVESLSAEVSGEGVLAAEAVPTWQAAFESTASIEVQIDIEFSSGTLTYTGFMHLESLEITAEQGGRVQMSVSLQSDGELTGAWTT
jgi:predicted secreted protein